MSIPKIQSRGIALAAVLLSTPLVAGAATAGSLPAANEIASTGSTQGTVQRVGHRGWGGIGIYVGPSYGHYPSYGYYDDDYYDYYPRRRSSYYYDDDRPYRKHSRRWVKERFEHPLGRR